MQTRAPSSIIAWLKSPGLSGSTSVLARLLKQRKIVNIKTIFNHLKIFLIFCAFIFCQHLSSILPIEERASVAAQRKGAALSFFPSASPFLCVSSEHFELKISQLFRMVLAMSQSLFFFFPGLGDNIHLIFMPDVTCHAHTSPLLSCPNVEEKSSEPQPGFLSY